MPLAFPFGRYWLPLLLVSALHAAALAGLWSAPASKPPVPPVMDIVVINEAAVPEPAAPVPEKPKVPPLRRPLPKPLPQSAPTPRPAPEPAPVPMAAPSLPESAPAVTAPALPAPVVTPPRIDASYRGNAAPSYPSASRRLGEQGTVILRLFVKADGSVGEVGLEKSSGFSRLDQAAMDTVKRWKLIPARRGNEPFATWYTLPLTFTLEK